MHPLLNSFRSWPGRRATKTLLESKGYWLPECYRKIVLANCGNCDAEKVERYWDEVAREYLCSAGRVDSNRRLFGGETSYRSEYLDGLASLPTSGQAAEPGLILDPGLQEFRTRSLATQGLFGNQISDQMENNKQNEILEFAITAEDWTHTKKDFYNYLERIARERHFVHDKKKWKKTINGIDILCSIDSGMQRTWKFQLPLNFEIVHNSQPDSVLCTNYAGYVMPGFEYYHLHRSPQSAILGIQAHVDLFVTIVQMVAGADCHQAQDI
jgi:hypothetical protein